MADGKLPDFLAIGQVVADIVDGRTVVGGASAYAAMTATRLGLRAAILTRPHQAFNIAAALPGVEVRCVGEPASTTFRNIETAAGREQYWLGDNAILTPQDVPDEWLKAPIVLLCPVAQEVSPDIVRLFPRALRGASPQGWLRKRDSDGRVSSTVWRHAVALLNHIDSVVVSLEDITAHQVGLTRLLMRAGSAVITRGRDGALVWDGHHWSGQPAFPANPIDTTGAGDVFMAAFLHAYSQKNDALTAARFAGAAAGLSVEGRGIDAIPTMEQVKQRLAPGGVP